MENIKLLKFLEEIGVTEQSVGLKENPPVLRLNRKQISAEQSIELAQILEGDNEIQVLDLQGNKIEDEGASAIAKILSNTKIIKVNLINNEIVNNEIGDKGVIAFATTLEGDNSILKKIFFGDNKIGNKAAKAFTKILKTDNILDYLYLGSRNIENAVLKELHEACKLQGEDFGFFKGGDGESGYYLP